jgi:hypothetical protein
MFGITLKSTIREFFPPLFLSSLQDYWKNSFHTGQTWNEYRKFYGACRGKNTFLWIYLPHPALIPFSMVSCAVTN